MKRIDNDIKTGQLKQIYLLYGQEWYLIRQYRDKLKKAIVAEDDTMNFTAFEGEETEPKALIDLAETMPFFAERRLILVEKSGLFQKGGDELAEYLKEVPATTYLLFVEEAVDKRSRLYKTAAKLGCVVEFAEQKGDILLRWINARLKGEGKSMSRETYELFIGRTGTDMENIDKELEKLVCYTMGRDVIVPEDVEAVTTQQIEGQIFVMVDAIADRRQKKALELYYDLLALKEPPMRILFLIMRHFRILLTVKAMSNQGFAAREIASKAGCPEWALKKTYLRQSRSFSVERIRQALQDGVAYEEAVKMGHMNDRMAVELLIVGYSST